MDLIRTMSSVVLDHSMVKNYVYTTRDFSSTGSTVRKDVQCDGRITDLYTTTIEGTLYAECAELTLYDCNIGTLSLKAPVDESKGPITATAPISYELHSPSPYNRIWETDELMEYTAHCCNPCIIHNTSCGPLRIPLDPGDTLRVEVDQPLRMNGSPIYPRLDRQVITLDGGTLGNLHLKG
ncbi:MAG: hypothetical protein KDK78_05140, partial [Chlamydiia bacterium]|nr:hypothetical protein [Chlamydiia bacterium]